MTETSETIRIVLVEDDAAIVRLLNALLRMDSSVQYDVHSAPNGCSGIELVRRVQPALVLADIMMPGMSGFEMCRALRSDPSTAGIPLIFLSSRSAPEDRVAGLSLGADDYLTKPYNAQELLLRIQAVLRRSAGSSAARPREVTAVELFSSSPRTLAAARLSFSSPIELLQSFGGQAPSGLLRISSHLQGTAELRDGYLIRAQIATHRRPVVGLKAWLRLLGLDEGIFEFLELASADEQAPPLSELPLQKLLMEAAYSRDEYERLRKLLPDGEIHLFRQAGASPGSGLVERAVWDSLADGLALDDLLDGLDFTDLEILRSIVQMLRQRQLFGKRARRER